MLKSTQNPRFATMSDSQVSDLYVSTYQSRNCDTMTDTELDQIESELFWLDDELCARGLDLPC
jgi:hypothetical protein